MTGHNVLGKNLLFVYVIRLNYSRLGMAKKDKTEKRKDSGHQDMTAQRTSRTWEKRSRRVETGHGTAVYYRAGQAGADSPRQNSA